MTKQTSPTQVRPSRVPLSGRNRLAVKNKEEGYVYRYVNANLENDPDRVERMQAAGYEIVPQAVAGKLGDSRVDNATPIGSSASIAVGQGTRAILMRIRQDWYKEDQNTKQHEIDAIEQTMRSESKADYGKLNPHARVDE
jgi:hypothetical protein